MKKQRFAVYGTLKEGHGNHRCLNGATKLGSFRTPANFTMYTNGYYPAVTVGGNTSILCEVYETDDQNVIDRVNALEGFRGKGNPNNHYDTETIETPFGAADMFVYRRTPNLPTIENGVF